MDKTMTLQRVIDRLVSAFIDCSLSDDKRKFRTQYLDAINLCNRIEIK